MAEKKTATKSTKKSAKRTTTNRTGTTRKSSGGFSAEERAAMKARAKELKAEERASKDRAQGERDVLTAIAAMKEPDRVLAKKLHAIVEATAPDLWPKTWYGFPSYARDGKIVLFFKSAEKFKTRYATLGFEEAAHLDDGNMWATSYALTKLTSADEAKIKALVKKAAR